MMIRAYDETFLFWAERHLASFLDEAVNRLAYPIDDIWTLFLTSPVSSAFAKGDSSVILGRSGKELLEDVLTSSGYGIMENTEEKEYRAERSPEYWTGYALAYYQWYTSLSFDEIDEAVKISEIRDLYSPYHEMDISSFVEKMETIRKKRIRETKLKRARENIGITQLELSSLSSVPVRTIQQYEQRQKNINRASGETLYALSKALYVNMEDLIEK